MTSKEQDKLWDDLSEESKEQMKERFSKKIEDSDPNAEYYRGIRYQTGLIFGRHNLRPKTYEDVAKELFEDGYYYYDYVYDRIVTNSAKPTMPMACTSQNQVRKLCAMNELLNIAKYLNKNEDGTDWVPDWENKCSDNRKWYIYIDEDKNIEYCWDNENQNHIVYFRTEALAKKAIEILGEEVILTALGNY